MPALPETELPETDPASNRRIPLARPGRGASQRRRAGILRVDHAGEYAAVHIYRAQRAVFEGRAGRESIAADMLRSMEPQLGKGRFHLVGEGMGGMVALAVATKYPDRVASLTLISAPGAQEYTLLGNAVANKFVYFFHHFIFN